MYSQRAPGKEFFEDIYRDCRAVYEEVIGEDVEQGLTKLNSRNKIPENVFDFLEDHREEYNKTEYISGILAISELSNCWIKETRKDNTSWYHYRSGEFADKAGQILAKDKTYMEKSTLRMMNLLYRGISENLGIELKKDPPGEMEIFRTDKETLHNILEKTLSDILEDY